MTNISINRDILQNKNAGNLPKIRARTKKGLTLKINLLKTIFIYASEILGHITLVHPSGMMVLRFKPAAQRHGYSIESIGKVFEASRNLITPSFTTTQKDDVAELVARDLAGDELDKVYGAISEDGSYRQNPLL
ncbi:hypothetical protein [Polynucleobacter yangtzensis]|nr:hypothetical protein [Polynucleobacter yangtzensis]